MSARFLLAIDQGTSSSRALVYDDELREVAASQQEFQQYYPRPGWVEHDADEIWASVTGVVRQALERAGIGARQVAAIGITNQRETTVVWDRASGEPLGRAIVWQDRRTADRCLELERQGVGRMLADKTGLRLDPYFSATKLEWMLRNVEGMRARAEAGELAFGTIDSFLVWRLTGGAKHLTDATNASRTLLYNIHTQAWDVELLDLFGIPEALLPEVCDNVASFGTAAAPLFDTAVPIGGVAGDQQAALIGQAGFDAGTIKSTFGTGCFVIANTGGDVVASQNQLLSTIASRMHGRVSYGLEGSVFVAGSAIQWLRDALGLVDTAQETEAIAAATGVVDDVVVVPAFAGLGAPYWDPYARGAIVGLTRGSGSGSIVTATLQAIAYQTSDLIRAMAEDGISPSVIRVDGGMVANNWFLQFLADILGIAVERPANVESTVLGAACLAGLSAGVLQSTEDIAALWRCERRFEPAMSENQRDALLAGWSEAVARVRSAR